MNPGAAIKRLAVLAAALSLGGCVGGPMAALPAADARSNAAAAEPPPDAAPVGNGGEAAARWAADNARLAMAPVPSAPAPAKPAAGAAPLCGAVAPGGNGRGLVGSGGKRFHIDCFRAAGAAPAPAVVILHGLHGIGRSTIYARLAEALNERGIHAFVYQYLTPDAPPAAAGSKAAAKPPAKTATNAAVLRPAARQQPGGKAVAPAKAAAKPPGVDSAAQARAIADAIGAVQALDYVDHRRIGMFGLSLGGFHALGLASRDERIGAVVDMFGAMPRAVAPEVKRMPPVLILHGDRDAVVPVRRAYELDKLLKRIGADHEMKIYKGQGHSFRGAADADSLSRAVEFFAKRLGAGATAAGPG